MLRDTSVSVSPADRIDEPLVDTDLKELSDPDINHEKNPDIIAEEEPVEIQEAVTSKNKHDSSDDIFDSEEIPVIEKKTNSQKKQSTVTEKTIGDKFSVDQSLMNEKLGKKIRKTDISSVHQSAPIKTITASLGINDKFFFIRELFNGDSDLFRQTVIKLDNSLNFNTAYTYLMDKFSWDMESESVQKLLNLIRRKFINPGNE
jgi:hypothetical protein